ELRPAEIHELVDAVARERPAQPDHDEEEREDLRAEPEEAAGELDQRGAVAVEEMVAGRATLQMDHGRQDADPAADHRAYETVEAATLERIGEPAAHDAPEQEVAEGRERGDRRV